MRKKHFKDIVEKGETHGNRHFLLIQQYVFHHVRKKLHHMSQIEIVVCKFFQFGQGLYYVVC